MGSLHLFADLGLVNKQANQSERYPRTGCRFYRTYILFENFAVKIFMTYNSLYYCFGLSYKLFIVVTEPLSLDRLTL